jgi:hypothetical protein
MGEPIRFEGCNTLMRGGADNVQDMRVFRNGTCSVSAWRLSTEELAVVVASGGVVYLSVFMGGDQPPVFVGSEDTVRGICADYGVWKKG